MHATGFISISLFILIDISFTNFKLVTKYLKPVLGYMVYF